MQSSPVLHAPPPPQSAFVEQALVVQYEDAHTLLVLVPQSAFEPQETVVHFALLQSTPLGHWASLAQLAALHLAPLQSLLTPQLPSPVHAAVAHLAPLHVLVREHAVSAAQLTVAHLALLHDLLTAQDRSSPQAFALHFTPVHTEPEEVQSVSTEQAVAVPQVNPLQLELELQVWPIFGPLEQVREQTPLVAPQIPLSQSDAL